MVSCAKLRGMSRTAFCLCAALLLASAGLDIRVQTQAAQPTNADVDGAIVNAFRWRSIGPLRGGRSIAVSGVKGRPREAYFGAVGGGLWKTVEGGLSWIAI